MRTILLGAMLSIASPLAASAQPQPAPQPAPAGAAAAQPIAVEYYYRIKWGSHGEFKRLYEKNHSPLLQEMRKAGHIVEVRTNEPFTHMAGGVRWDYRVTITYPDAARALVSEPFQKDWEAAEKRLYPDRKRFEEEEARRFSLLEDHWDVVVY